MSSARDSSVENVVKMIGALEAFIGYLNQVAGGPD
jgi:hypothetical protein